MNKTKKIAAVVALALLLCFAVTGAFAWLEYKTGQLTNTFTIGKIEAELFESATTNNGREKATGTAAGEVTANDYKLTPGGRYVKDPTVRIKQGSEPCYVRMFVKVDLRDMSAEDLKTALQTKPELLQDLVNNEYIVQDTTDSSKYTLNTTKLLGMINGWSEDKWTREAQWFALDGGIEDKTKVIVEYRYAKDGGVVNASTADVELDPLFTGFNLPMDFPPSALDFVVKQFGGDAENAENLPQLIFVAQAIQAEGFDDATTFNNVWTSNSVAPPAGFEHADEKITLPSFSLPAAPTP